MEDVRLLAIGEFSAMCRLSVKALRHYHDLGLLVPAAVDPVTGYRAYVPEQAGRALAIRELRALDLPLADIAAVLDAGDDRRTALLERHRDRLADDLDRAVRRLLDIRSFLEGTVRTIDITDQQLPPQLVVSRRVTGPVGMEQLLTSAAITELHAELVAAGVEPADVPLLLVHGGDEITFDQEACLPVPEGTAIAGAWTLGGCTASVASHKGPLDRVQLVVHEVLGHVVARHGAFALPIRLVLRSLPPAYGDTEVPVVEVAVPYEG